MDYPTWQKQFPFDEQIGLKIAHIERVMKNSAKITGSLKLGPANRQLAEFIAQHHDDGRFPQWTEFHTFSDREHAHAALSIGILFDENHIDEWGASFDAEERRIIYVAIARHSQFHPETSDLTERELLHLNIIRDADVLDNLSHTFLYDDLDILMQAHHFTAQELFAAQITPEVYSSFMSHKDIAYASVKTPLDLWVLWASQVNQLVFPASRDILRSANWPNRMFGRIRPTSPSVAVQVAELTALATKLL